MNVKQTWVVVLDKFVSSLPGAFGKLLLIILIFISSAIVIKVGKYVINKVIEKQKGFRYYGDTKRLDTLGTILCSMLRYGVYFIAIVTILTSVLKIFNIGTVLAAAGIGGVALGFGAQSLVKDVISGFFILAENQFSVGDVVTIENLTGTIEEMELRVTKIRNFNGELYIIPNGGIKMVNNQTKGDRMAIVDSKVSYDVNIDSAIKAIGRACELLEKESKVLAEVPQVLGVTEFGETSYVVRAVVKTVGAEHWKTERDLRRNIILCFEEDKIKLGVILTIGDKK